jgi:chorismate mutase
MLSSAHTDPDQTDPELAELRHSIDNIDAAVLHLLAERFKCINRKGQR